MTRHQTVNLPNLFSSQKLPDTFVLAFENDLFLTLSKNLLNKIGLKNSRDRHLFENLPKIKSSFISQTFQIQITKPFNRKYLFQNTRNILS